jgi:broad specificity phosphatase PhoE
MMAAHLDQFCKAVNQRNRGARHRVTLRGAQMSEGKFTVFRRGAAAAGLVGLLTITAPFPDRRAFGSVDLPAFIVLVRHAEKEKEAAHFDPDPYLTAAGRMRARDLAVALGNAHLTAIVTTQYRRTQETAKPTADALRLTPQIINVPDVPDESEQLRGYVTEMLELLRKQPGGAVLVVGHSNTVPALIEALTEGPPLPAICDTVYDKVFILIPNSGGKPSLVSSRYGTASGTQGCE